VKPRTGSRSTNSGPRNAYKTKDGKFVALSASTQKMAERVFASIGRADLIDNPRYRTNADRVKNAKSSTRSSGEFIAQKTQAENVAFFEKAEVTIGPIYDITPDPRGSALHRPRVLADYPDAEMGRFPMHPRGAALSGTPATIGTPAPEAGEHNRALLAESRGRRGHTAKLLADAVRYETPRAGASGDSPVRRDRVPNSSGTRASPIPRAALVLRRATLQSYDARSDGFPHSRAHADAGAATTGACRSASAPAARSVVHPRPTAPTTA
jgi:hypothetical protein